MTEQTQPMGTDLASRLVDWYHEEQTFLMEIDHSMVAVLNVEEGPVFEYLDAVLEPGLLMRTASGWCVPDWAVLEEVRKAQAVLRNRVSSEVEQAADILRAQAPASTPEPGPPVEDEKKDLPGKPSRKRPRNAVAWPLCDASRIDAELKGMDSRDKRRPVLDRWKQRPERWLPRATRKHVKQVNALEQAFPNFSEVIHYVRRHLMEQVFCEEPVHVPPMLLLGPPGVGKTAFGQKLAEVLGARLLFQSLAELTAGFAITGMTQGWANGAPGLIARALLDLPDGQPLILLFDELDKARQDTTHPTDSVLLGLLDPVTSQSFRDEFLELPLDIAPVSFLFTANRTRGIRPELLSRMQVIEVPPPTASQMPAIVRSVDAAIRAKKPRLAEHLAPLEPSLIDRLACQPPRDLMRCLEDAYATAVEEALDSRDPKRIIRLDQRHLGRHPGDTPSNGNPTDDSHDPADGPLLVLPKEPERVH